MSLYIGGAPVKINLGDNTYKAKFYKFDPGPCLTFSSSDTFSINVTNPGWNGTMEYSTDGNTWGIWDGSMISGTTICIRGSNNTIIGGYSSNNAWTLTGADIACAGNVETLLDYTTVQAGDHPSMTPYYCYSHMFYGCTSLTQAPALPATTLASSCYSHMFYGCTSLTTIPALPATTLASSCYSYMFYGCTSLTQAPALPATTLASSCYSHMFYGCTSLTTIPALPATTLASSCYSYMFYGCTSLTTIPALPATTLASSCYSYMFYDCTNIIVYPDSSYGHTQEYRVPSQGSITGTAISIQVSAWTYMIQYRYKKNYTNNMSYCDTTLYLPNSITIV